MKEGSKGAKKGRRLSFLVHAFPPLSLAYLARYPSYEPVVQAKNRLGGGWGGGSTLLFMFSLCRIIGWNFNGVPICRQHLFIHLGEERQCKELRQLQ